LCRSTSRRRCSRLGSIVRAVPTSRLPDYAGAGGPTTFATSAATLSEHHLERSTSGCLMITRRWWQQPISRLHSMRSSRLHRSVQEALRTDKPISDFATFKNRPWE
jgi:hypothetical protein